MSTAVGAAPAAAPAASGGAAPGAAPADGARPSQPPGAAKPPQRQPVVEHKQPPGQKSAQPPAKKEPPPDWYKKIDLKLGDETETLEFESHEELVHRLQRERAQNKAWQRKHTALEQKERAFQQAKGDPFAAVKQLDENFDVDAFVLQRAHEMMQREQMDPKDRALQEHQQKIAEYERREQQRLLEERTAQEQAQAEANRKRWQKKMLDAIEEVAPDEDAEFKASMLPTVAGIMYHARQMNPEGDPALEITPKEIAAEVKRLNGRNFDRGLSRAPLDKLLPVASKHLSALDDAGLLKTLGEQMVARIVKAHLDSSAPLRAAPSQFDPPPSAPVRGDEAERRETMGIRVGRSIPRLG